MDDLVIMRNQQAVTTSLQVAETFGKNHKDVLRALDNLKIGSSKLRRQMFAESTYVNRGKKYRQVYMNRDGFTLLAMGFTGDRALNFKLKYIQAFNKMEKAIEVQAKDSYMIEDPIARADKWKQEYLERKQLKEENEKLQIPALLGTAVSASSTSVTVGNFAKVLKQNGVDTGQNRLFQWLRERGYLIRHGRRYNAPTQYSMELGIMEVRETVVTTNHGSKPHFTPLITGKGQQYFTRKFLQVPVKED